MKKTKLISCLLAATLLAASFAGCGNSSAEEKEDTALKQEQNQNQNQDQDQNQNQDKTMAKVISLEEDNLTVIVADMPDNQEGEAPPDDALQPDGEDQPGEPEQGGGEIAFTGEKVTYTLSDDVKVTKGIGENAAEIDLSEIAVDSLIIFTTSTDDDENEVITSIRIME